MTARLTKSRLELQRELPDVWDAMVRLDGAIGLDEDLRILVKLRASLLNGCLYCIELHGREGLEAGYEPARLLALSAWQESPLFDDRERAALALTDAITLVSQGHVSDNVWQEAVERFDREELAQLVWTITAINSWNRVAISTRIPPGR